MVQEILLQNLYNKNETDTPWLDILSVDTLKLEVVGDKRNACPYPQKYVKDQQYFGFKITEIFTFHFKLHLSLESQQKPMRSGWD